MPKDDVPSSLSQEDLDRLAIEQRIQEYRNQAPKKPDPRLQVFFMGATK